MFLWVIKPTKKTTTNVQISVVNCKLKYLTLLQILNFKITNYTDKCYIDYHTSIYIHYITWSWYNGFWCFPCDPYFWTELIYSVGRTLLVLIPLLFQLKIGLRDQCEYVNESGKHCSHEKILVLLTSSLCFSMSLTHITFYSEIVFIYNASKLIIHQYACMLVHQRHYWLYLKQEMFIWEWLTCLCCFFFSDIPRIPDTSHPPLESSRYPLRDVGTSLYLYACMFISISVSYWY